MGKGEGMGVASAEQPAQSPPDAKELKDPNGASNEGPEEKAKGSWMPAQWEILTIVLTVTPMVGFTVMQPYKQTRQAELECGAMCVGSMTSAASALGIFGSPLIGALSDHQGRKFGLAVGCIASAVSFFTLGFTNSLIGLWISLVPQAMLSHNFTISKAVVADLAPAHERAGILGKLGLALGVGFMSGPVFNPFIKTHQQAALFATALQICSLFAVHKLPSMPKKSDDEAHGKKDESSVVHVFHNVMSAIKEVVVLAIAAPPNARVILLLRFGLSLCFHLFYTLLQVLLRERFSFGPSDFSNYFAFIGATYALSQLFSKFVINRFSDNPTNLVAVCICLLGVGRFITASTHNIAILYSSMTLTIMSLGVMNTSINTIVTRFGSKDKVGGLMGVLDTAEKLAGVVGPTLGGALYSYNAFAPVVAVVSSYVVLSVMVFFGFPRYVLPALEKSKTDKTE